MVYRNSFIIITFHSYSLCFFCFCFLKKSNCSAFEVFFKNISCLVIISYIYIYLIFHVFSMILDNFCWYSFLFILFLFFFLYFSFDQFILKLFLHNRKTTIVFIYLFCRFQHIFVIQHFIIICSYSK